jgi:hypothetical protein
VSVLVVTRCDQCGRSVELEPETLLPIGGDMLSVNIEDMGTQEFWVVNVCSFKCLKDWSLVSGKDWDKVTAASRRMAATFEEGES